MQNDASHPQCEIVARQVQQTPLEVSARDPYHTSTQAPIGANNPVRSRAGRNVYAVTLFPLRGTSTDFTVPGRLLIPTSQARIRGPPTLQMA